MDRDGWFGNIENESRYRKRSHKQRQSVRINIAKTQSVTYIRKNTTAEFRPERDSLCS